MLIGEPADPDAGAEGFSGRLSLRVVLENSERADATEWERGLEAAFPRWRLRVETGEERPGEARVIVESETIPAWRAQRARVEAMAKRLARQPGIRSIDVLTGTQPYAEEAFRLKVGEITALLPEGDARRAWREIRPDFDRMMTGIPGIVMNTREPDAGPPVGKPIQVEIGSRYADLIAPALLRVRNKMESMPGLRDIDDTRPVPGIEWQVEVDRIEASRYGADIARVGNAIQYVTNGLEVGTYRPEGTDDEVEIRVRYPRPSRSLDALGELRIATPSGLIPVTQFVKWKPAPKVGSIQRSDSLRVLKVSANVKDGYLVDDLKRELEHWVAAEAKLDPRLQVRFRGEDEEQRKAESFLQKAFIVALFIMGIILVTQFNNFYHAFLILSAVIFSTIGVFLGLIFTHQPFGIVMNGIGVIALAGIVVNNNIVLIDTYDYLRKRGMAPYEGVLRTGAQRLRPVMLTTVTTVLGLLPMVFKVNIDFINRHVSYGAPSTQWWTQLATSVVFGLVFATGLTLILTPTLLYLGEKLFRRDEVKAEWAAIRERRREARAAGAEA